MSTLRPALLLALLSAGLEAQELVGVVRHPGDGAPAAGIVVVALRDSDGGVLGRAVSGDNGAYLLRVPAGTLRLRALRIGYRPTDLGRVTLAEGERRRLDLTLVDAPIVLATVTTRARAQCEVAARAGEAVVTLFEEARKALLATLLAPPEGRPSARVLLETAVDEPDGRPRSIPVRRVREGLAARPFRAAPARQLARLGYRVEEPDGATYFAPDADVLLSEEFAADHCLRVVEGGPGHPQRIGLAFEPTERTRDIVRIRGTIWLDRTTFALELLEYQYVGLPGGLDRRNLGGTIAFTRLPGGLFFEDAWEIRMPVVVVEPEGGVGGRMRAPRSERIRLDAVQRNGGRVLRIGRGDRVLYASAGAEPEGVPADEPESARTADLLIRAACPAEPLGAREPRSVVVGLVLAPVQGPVPGAAVAATYKEEFRINSKGDISWTNRELSTRSTGDGFFAICGLPRERRIELQASRNERRSPRLLVRFEAHGDHLRADLHFPAPP